MIAGMIRHISAVTFPVRDMARSMGFYKMVGIELVYGGDRSSFSSLQASEAFVNLLASPNCESRWSGRTIFRVENVDGHYRGSASATLSGRSAAECDLGRTLLSRYRSRRA